LRERCTDIALLAQHFIAQLAGNKAGKLTPETEAILASHSWPGNVRELRNVMERAFVLSAGRPVITPEQIRLRKPCSSLRAPSETS